MEKFKEKEIPDLNIKNGDLVLFNGISENYNLNTGWDKPVEAVVLYQKESLIVTHINKFGIECGFHFSRFRKIIAHAAGKQLTLEL